jgi:hypothetical protein
MARHLVYLLMGTRSKHIHFPLLVLLSRETTTEQVKRSNVAFNYAVNRYESMLQSVNELTGPPEPVEEYSWLLFTFTLIH